MVDLPRYVKIQVKPNGRVFGYYERYRNTAQAWPRLPLAAMPDDALFWTRCRICEHLFAERTGNGWTWRYAPPSGRSHDLPDPRADLSAFWTAADKAADMERRLASGEAKTFRALIEQYREHEAYKKLSASAKGDYDRYLDVIEAAWADDPVRELTAVDAQAAIDAYQHAPASGRYFRSVLSKLVAFGVPRGYSTTNPVEHTEKPSHSPEPYKPWEPWAFELFMAHARSALHLAVWSALFTGQRKVDVVPMLRPKSDAKVIELVARKTKASIWVPIHSEYREIITGSKSGSVRLHLREDGEPWTYEGFATAWQREFTTTYTDEDEPTPEQREHAATMKRLRDAKVVFHGLRKNAVNMLLEVGSTEAQVASIVEMSEQMVRHYAKDVDKRRLAIGGMRKLEEGWKAMRLEVVGRSGGGA